MSEADILEPWRFFILSIVCGLITISALLPGVQGGFDFDDGPNIVKNTAVHLENADLHSILVAAYSFQPGGGSRALPMLSFAADYWLHGLDPQWFKTTNLIIHFASIIAVVYFLRMLLGLAGQSPRRAAVGALIVALFWAVHPMQVSSVLYIVQRMQTLVTLFVVIALIFYLRARGAQIRGEASRIYWLLMAFFWCFAIASKEDAALLPAYLLVLEATVLQFRAKDASLTVTLKRGYTVAFAAGCIAFLFVVVPHYWEPVAYAGRDYGSWERLMTQGRVLVMYVAQSLVPIPQILTFFYDDLAPSRGLFTPLSTFFALMLVIGLLVCAWMVRTRRPVFSFGILFFFAGHAITSNVVGLELAFEHRNHLPLIGLFLSITDLIYVGLAKKLFSRRVLTVVASLCFLSFSGLTVARATTWGDPIEFGKQSVIHSPMSARAWLSLCSAYFEMSASKPDSPYLQKAIDTCSDGSKIGYSATLLANVVTFRTVQGTVTDLDWERLISRLDEVPMSAENRGLAWNMINNLSRGIALDETQALKSIEVIAKRASFGVVDSMNIGYFFLDQTSRPQDAFFYFEQAVRVSSPDDKLVPQLLENLKARELDDWAERLEVVASRR